MSLALKLIVNTEYKDFDPESVHSLKKQIIRTRLYLEMKRNSPPPNWELINQDMMKRFG